MCSYVANRALFEPLAHQEIDDNDMEQYMSLDLDEALMREDVAKLGLKLRI